MLYVVFNQGLALGWDNIKWSIGNPKPLGVERSKYKKADYHEQMAAEAEARWLAMVAYIRADGEELKLIMKQYGTYCYPVSYSIPFPITFKDSVSWYGDIARTILMNL